MCRKLFLSTLLVGALLFGATECRGQTLHALVVGDQSEWAHWGKFLPNIQMDMLQMSLALGNNVPENRLEMRMATIESPEDGSPAAILGALDSLRPSPRDTLLLYYTGHGGLDDQGHFLALEKGNLYREELKQRMLAKQARLTVLLTDCCNTRSDGFQSAFPYAPPQPPDRPTPVFQALFFDPQGWVDINACSPSESAQFFVEKDGALHRGSLFTRSLTDYLDRRRDVRVGWEELLRDVSVSVLVAFRRDYPDGVPLAKGPGRQAAQTVYAAAYPGMPENRGPRTGMQIRDHGGQGVLITRIEPGSPGSKVYDLAARRYTSLQTNQIIRTANGHAVQGAADFVELAKTSPQVMRLEVGHPQRGWKEYLMRLKY
jgi:hypothetical protein